MATAEAPVVAPDDGEQSGSLREEVPVKSRPQRGRRPQGCGRGLALGEDVLEVRLVTHKENRSEIKHFYFRF